VENWFLKRNRFMHSHFSDLSEWDRDNPTLLDETYLQDMLRIFFEGITPSVSGRSSNHPESNE
jgi:hypothetical protein